MDGSAWPVSRQAGMQEGMQEGRPPRLLVTGHFVFAGQVGGAEHMFYNLVRGLGDAGVPPLVLCAREGNLHPGFVAELGPGRLLGCGGGGPRFLGEQRAVLRRGLSADGVLFPNYFVPPVVPGRLGRVTTVMHDVQFRHFPQYFSRRKRAWLAASQALAMRRADTVVAISDFVRDDLLSVYGKRFEHRVVTIPNPISWDRFDAPGQAEEPPLARPYILSVAAQYEHKNLPVLVRAFAEVARRDPDLVLVFCGQSYDLLRGVAGSRDGLGPLVAELGLEDRVHLTGYVDDAALGRWYRHAAMFAFPSVFEGFGMPPIEALGFGLPTLTTKRTALPETTMGLAVGVDDPHCAAEWADRILQVWRDPQEARPQPADVARLRTRYSLAAVGRQYAHACLR